MKPDVTAPGVDILSSVPGNQWSPHDWSGTSMASPHVAGAAALLLQRHPTWTVAQIKSALTPTGDPVHARGRRKETGATREGGGRIDLARADNPLIFVAPTGLSFGLVHRAQTVAQTIDVTDAAAARRLDRGGGAADLALRSDAHRHADRRARDAVTVTLTTAADAAEGDVAGFVVLTRGTDTAPRPVLVPRRPCPQLGTEPHTLLLHPGVYHGNTRASRRASRRTATPSSALPPRIPLDLSGPEQVFRFVAEDAARQLRRRRHPPRTGCDSRAAARARGRREPARRLHRPAGEPQPVPATSATRRPAVGAILPAPGLRLRLRHAVARQARRVHLPLLGERHDAAADPAARPRTVARRSGSASPSPTAARASIRRRSPSPSTARRHATHTRGRSSPCRRVAPGTHRIAVTASDYQETKNMEDVGPILPNTRTVHDDRRRPLGARVAAVGLLDRRQLREVALDARSEIVRVRRDDAKRRLAPGPVAPASRVGPDVGTQA